MKMTHYISLIVVLLTWIYNLDVVYSQGNLNPSASQIKSQITLKNIEQFVGIGGRYGQLQMTVSKHITDNKNVIAGIESDHFPPKSLYKYAKDNNIKGIKQEDMGAVSLLWQDHRKFGTTGTPQNGRMAKHDMDELKKSFQDGNYFKAIDKNINMYEKHNLLGQIKPGVYDALNVHVMNGLINENQREQIINKYKLGAPSSSSSLPSRYKTGIVRIQAIDKIRSNIQKVWEKRKENENLKSVPIFYSDKKSDGCTRSNSDPIQNRIGIIKNSDKQTQGLGVKWNNNPELARRGSTNNITPLSSHGGYGTQKLNKIGVLTSKLNKLNTGRNNKKRDRALNSKKSNKTVKRKKVSDKST